MFPAGEMTKGPAQVKEPRDVVSVDTVNSNSGKPRSIAKEPLHVAA